MASASECVKLVVEMKSDGDDETEEKNIMGGRPAVACYEGFFVMVFARRAVVVGAHLMLVFVVRMSNARAHNRSVPSTVVII